MLDGEKFNQEAEANDSFITDSLNSGIIFAVLVGIYIFLTFISNSLFFTEELYYRSFSDQLTIQSIEAFWELQEQYRWLGYVLMPLIVLLKVVFATVCISIGVVLSTIEFKFKTVFKTVLLAEVVFVIAQSIYLINLSFHLDTLTVATVSNYFPFTVLSYFGTENVVDWLQYPLQTLNVFEAAYMGLIAWLLSKQWKPNFIESLSVVVPSYGTGLILWLVLVTFLTLQIS